MRKDDLTKAEQKWRNRPFFGRRRRRFGIVGGFLLVIVIIILASYGLFAGNDTVDSLLNRMSMSERAEPMFTDESGGGKPSLTLLTVPSLTGAPQE